MLAGCRLMGALKQLQQPVLVCGAASGRWRELSCRETHMCPWLSQPWPGVQLSWGNTLPVWGMCSGTGMWGRRGHGDIRLPRHQGLESPKARQGCPRLWLFGSVCFPLTCSEFVLHTQSSPRLFLQRMLSSATISLLFTLSGENNITATTPAMTTAGTTGKEQKSLSHPLRRVDLGYSS